MNPGHCNFYKLFMMDTFDFQCIPRNALNPFTVDINPFHDATDFRLALPFTIALQIWYNSVFN